MNILQMCHYDCLTNFGAILENFNNKVITKYKLANISFASYDAFIITIDFLEEYEENKDNFLKIESLKKPIIYIYHSNNKPNDIGMKLLAEKYNLKFNLSDCSVLDTDNWNYKPYCYNEEDEAYSIFAKSGEGKCFIKNTNQFYIYKKKNIIIMHDLVIKYNSMGLVVTTGLTNMVKYILQTNVEESNTSVDWLPKIIILNDKELSKKKKKNVGILEEIRNEQKQLKNEMDKNNYYKRLLYCSGDKLVEVVECILKEMLNVEIDDRDQKRQDLFFKLDNVNILVEVKGVNHPFQRDNISQVKRHVKDFAEAHDIYGADVEKYCKGVLIINPYSIHDLKDKIGKEFYSNEVIADAEYEKVCTLDTFTLLNYYSKWRNNPGLINLKEILLNNNYNKPDYDEIINI